MWDSDFCVEIMRMKNSMELSFVVLIWTTMVWYDERRFVIPVTEQRAGGLLRMLKYSVSRYWCNGIRGFHMAQWGCFWWVFVYCIIRRPTVPVLHLSFSTSSGRRSIHIIYHFFCVLHLEYYLWNYPGAAQDQGYRRQLKNSDHFWLLTLLGCPM